MVLFLLFEGFLIKNEDTFFSGAAVCPEGSKNFTRVVEDAVFNFAVGFIGFDNGVKHALIDLGKIRKVVFENAMRGVVVE